MEILNRLLRKIVPSREKQILPMGPVIFYSDRIWNSTTTGGEHITSIDRICDLLGRRLEETEVELLAPITYDSTEVLRVRLANICRMSLPTVVIPQRAKIDVGGSSMWVTVNPEQFIRLCRRYKVPLYRLGVGRLYPPETKVNLLPETQV